MSENNRTDNSLLVHEATGLAYFKRKGMLKEQQDLEREIRLGKEIDEHFRKKKTIKDKVKCLFSGHGELIKVDNIEACKRCGNVKFR